MYSKYIDIYVYIINKQGQMVEVPAFILRKVAKMAFVTIAYERDNKTIVCEVAKEQGMVFSNTIWFKKPSFEKAKKAFLLDYLTRIQKMDAEVKALNDKWSILHDQQEVIK